MPLFLVAGLPKATALGVRTIVEKVYGKPCVVQCSASRTSDQKLYGDEYVGAVISQAASFSKRRRTNADVAPVTPEFIYLLYVPSPDVNNLLRAFDFSVFPISMTELSAWGQNGQQMRHHPEMVAQSLEAAIARLKEAAEIKNRIRLLRPGDAVLLPPINFHLSVSERISSVFLEFRNGARPWSDRVPEISAEEFNSETLVPLKDRMTRRCFKDSRGIIFFQPLASGYHGNQWVVDEVTPANAPIVLRALYRFGAPLPQGFQHDAQYERGRTFKSEIFNCCENGAVSVTDTHANIYPNDFVRARGMGRQNK